MRWMIATLVARFRAASASDAGTGLLVNVTLDHDQERDCITTQGVFGDLARFLSGAIDRPVERVMTRNAQPAGVYMRSNACFMLPAPVQPVGLVTRIALPHREFLGNPASLARCGCKPIYWWPACMEGGRLPGASRLLT
jgi:hypothetical protein